MSSLRSGWYRVLGVVMSLVFTGVLLSITRGATESSGSVAKSVLVRQVNWDENGYGASNAVDSVAEAAGNFLPEEETTFTIKIKTALVNNPAMSGSNIDVEVSDNTVTLIGSAKNQEQIQLAGMIARSRAPGYSIINRLRVQHRRRSFQPRHRRKQLRRRQLGRARRNNRRHATR